MGWRRDETEIMEVAVDCLLKVGYNLSVFDSEWYTLQNSTSREEVMKALRTTDDDYLYVDARFNLEDVQLLVGCFGWVRFVYGNSGWDVICDYTTNLEEVLGPANALADKLEQEG